VAIAAGADHACAILMGGTVRCWGEAANGRLGYGNTTDIGDNELPSTAGPVNVGAGRKAVAIAAGGSHTCVILDTGQVRCWGFGSSGELGQGNTDWIGDNETPGSVPPVHIGAGRKAIAITAGSLFSCVLLDNGKVRCWGFGGQGRLGYGNTNTIGDNELPDTLTPVALGRKAVALSSGDNQTCALLDNGAVRCWGNGTEGKLGLGNLDNVGDTETPGSVAPVSLGRKAVAVSAGVYHSCALLVNGRVRCWGRAFEGELGLGNQTAIGDTELPSSVGPVDLGGKKVAAVGAGGVHVCVLLVNGTLRCWGPGGFGRLGYGNTVTIGDTETPAALGPVPLGGLMSTKKRPALSLRLSKQRDPAAPYGVAAFGRLTGGYITDRATCSGKVAVKATNGPVSVVKRPLLRFRNGGCTYRVYFRFAGSGLWKFSVRFAGNGSLVARSSRSRTFRAG
jgi:alpha-tubulin suppressor-like RCC1 family protein